jgi:hypothetical protein
MKLIVVATAFFTLGSLLTLLFVVSLQRFTICLHSLIDFFNFRKFNCSGIWKATLFNSEGYQVTDNSFVKIDRSGRVISGRGALWDGRELREVSFDGSVIKNTYVVGVCFIKLNPSKNLTWSFFLNVIGTEYLDGYWCMYDQINLTCGKYILQRQ